MKRKATALELACLLFLIVSACSEDGDLWTEMMMTLGGSDCNGMHSKEGIYNCAVEQTSASMP